jgi:hypothetical protein
LVGLFACKNLVLIANSVAFKKTFGCNEFIWLENANWKSAE